MCFSTSARLLDDGVIDPRDTRAVLAEVLAICREAEATQPAGDAVFGRAAMSGESRRTPFQKILIANRGEIALRSCELRRRLGYGWWRYIPPPMPRAACRERTKAVGIGEAFAVAIPICASIRLSHGEGQRRRRIHPGYAFLARTKTSPPPAGRGAGVRRTIAGSHQGMGTRPVRKKSCRPPAFLRTGYQGRSARCGHAGRGRHDRFSVMIKAVAGAAGAACGWCADRRISGSFAQRALRGAKRVPATHPLSWSAPLSIHVTSKSRCSRSVWQRRSSRERDCSVQRGIKKLIEEAPSPAVSPELRARDGRHPQ